MKALSNQEFKNIKRYQLKKYRLQDFVFLAEGKKLVNELISSEIEIKVIIIREDYQEKSSIADFDSYEIRVATDEQFKKLTSQKTADGVLAVCEIPKAEQVVPENDWSIALDAIQDPGNLGTIIRIADWFNISTIICNVGTVDAYNPKVVQATMGSIARVNIIYKNLEEELSKFNGIVYGATLGGESIYTLPDYEPGMIIIGNESNGISAPVLEKVTKEVTIPRLGQAESLNAGVATAILVSQFLNG